MKKKEIIFFLVLILIIFALYWNTLDYELIWDTKILLFQDNILLTENLPLWSAFNFGYFHDQIGINNVDFYYRPLLTASFMIENKLWELNSANLRLSNIIIYILSLLFLYLFFRSQSNKNYFAEIAILLFALFPLNIDNIVWVVGRGDLLLLLWASLTFLFLELFVKKRNSVLLILSSFFYLLGLLSKEAFLFFFPFLLLYEWVKRKKISLPYHIFNIVVSILFLVIKNTMLGIKNLGVVISSNFLENIKIVFATLGYYFRSLVFPFYYDVLIPMANVMNFFYVLMGILAILFFAFLLYKSKKNKEIIPPLGLILIFVGGHLYLSFTVLYPFNIYSRYMMIPAIGLAWILSVYLCRIKEKTRIIIVAIILLLFIPSVIINSHAYKTEFSFFQKLSKSFPENSYLLFKMAKIAQEKNDYLTSEVILNRALSFRQKKETAIMVSLLYATIEAKKSSYDKFFQWIGSIENMESSLKIQLAPFIKSKISQEKALVYISQGKTEQAEKLLKQNIQEYENKRDAYEELHRMYMSFGQWDKAEEFEKIMKARFPSFAGVNTIQRKKEFESLPVEKKISFYIHFRNFNKAIEIINSISKSDLPHKILLAKLHYWAGKEKEASGIIDEILSTYPDDYQILNTIGNFYLRDLFRAEEALIHFKKSLEMNKDQPQIFSLVNQLTENYLKRIKKII